MVDWDGSPLHDGVIAIALDGLHDPPGPHLIAFADGDDGEPVGLGSDRIGDFLVVHAQRQFVCYDAADLHWRLVELLTDPADAEAFGVLWDLPRHGRLHDVMLLEQRLRVAEEGVQPLPRPLDKLVRLCVRSESASAPLQAALAVYHQLLSRATVLLSRLDIDPALVERYGPLGHGIDVQGAIAVSGPDRTLRVDLAVAARLERAMNEVYAESSAHLLQDRTTAKIFRSIQAGNLVASDKAGRPQFDRDLLRSWLERELGGMVDVNGQPWTVPLDDRGGLSLLPEHWGLLEHCTPGLRAWSGLMRSARVTQFFRSLAADGCFSAEYRVVPRLHAFMPDLGYVAAHAPGLFQAASGHGLIRCQYRSLEVRCLAMLCHRHVGTGHLVELFQHHEDVVSSLAQWLEVNTRTEEDAGLPGLSAAEWEPIVCVLLLALARGFSHEQVCELLRYDRGSRELPAADVHHLHDTLRERLCPEVQALLDDQTIDQIARNIGVQPVVLYRRLQDEVAEPQSLNAMLRNVLLGRRENPKMWAILQGMARDPPAQAVLSRPQPRPAARELLRSWAVTPFGRVGAPGYLSQCRSAACLDFFDDLMKLTLFEVAAAGFPIVAVRGQEFVVAVVAQFEADYEAAAEQIIARVNAMTRGFTFAGKAVRRLPMEFDWEPISRW